MDHSKNPPGPLPDDLLDRYLLGRATPEEHATIEALTRSLPHFADWVAAVQTAPAHDERLLNVNRIRDLIVQQTGTGPDLSTSSERPIARLGQRPVPGIQRRPTTAFSRRVSIGIGALAAGIAVYALVFTSAFHKTEPAQTAPQEYAAASGQLTPATLPDGTEILLAPGSRVQLSPEFGKSHRDVYLNGKAYFSVAQDPTRPFAVITNAASVQVLGTKFVVERYDNDRSVQVAVESGRVFVTKSTKFARENPSASGKAPLADATPVFAEVLNAGDLLDATDDRQPVLTHSADISRALTWTTGVLAFTNIPASRLTSDVERWYGVQLRFNGSATMPVTVREKLVTTTFDHVPLSVVVRELSALFGVHVTTITPPSETIHAI